MNGMGMSGMGALWPLFILFWILLIAGVVVVIGWLLRGKTDSPLEILRRRYAGARSTGKPTRACARNSGKTTGE